MYVTNDPFSPNIEYIVYSTLSGPIAEARIYLPTFVCKVHKVCKEYVYIYLYIYIYIYILPLFEIGLMRVMHKWPPVRIYVLHKSIYLALIWLPR